LILKDVFPALGLAQELPAMIGVGNVDQGHGPLTDAFAPQIGHAVFGDHVVDVAATGDDSGAAIEGGLDAAHLTVARGRRKGDHRLPSNTASGAPDEVDLATDAGEELAIDRVGCHLPGQVHGQGRVDGDHSFVTGDDQRIVGEVTRSEFEHRVIVHPIVQIARAHDEGGDDLARQERLLLAIDHAALD